ncbi:tyrosine kinase, putative, partial [Entamoeba invadens IP1]
MVFCSQCKEGFSPIETLNKIEKYDFCIPISQSQIADCKYSLISQFKCVECLDTFKLKNGNCSEKIDDNENNTCDPQYYLSSTFTCEPLGNLFTKCELTLPTGGGCAICKDHYYKQKTDCISCDESCGTCVDGTSCLSCRNEYFKLSGSENKFCVSYDNLTNCETKTPIGCVKCENGYFLDNYICKSCSDNCISCDNDQNCKICVENDYVLVDSQCVNYKSIEF